MDTNKQNKEIEEQGPPFFKNWKGMYTFLLVFQLILIVIFIWITNTYAL